MWLQFYGTYTQGNSLHTLVGYISYLVHNNSCPYVALRNNSLPIDISEKGAMEMLEPISNCDPCPANASIPHQFCLHSNRISLKMLVDTL